MQSFHSVYSKYFPIGTAVSLYHLPQTRNLITKHFNSITPENLLKPQYIRPAINSFDFTDIDIIADFAKQNRCKLRGHTLIWHNQVPDFFFLDGDRPADRITALARMKEHIQTVIGRYRTMIYAWDVVNGAISDDPGGSDLRVTKWLECIGEDYIEAAYRFAYEAGPDCVLFYNDYNETDPVKSKRIYNLIKGLKSDGVPVDGIGMQGHYNLYSPEIDEIRRAIELYASLGVEIQITELDVSLYASENDIIFDCPPPELLELQAERYASLFETFRLYKKYITGVTFWGVSDSQSWLNDYPVNGRKDWPLLFDRNLHPKSCMLRVMEDVARE